MHYCSDNPRRNLHEVVSCFWTKLQIANKILNFTNSSMVKVNMLISDDDMIIIYKVFQLGYKQINLSDRDTFSCWVVSNQKKKTKKPNKQYYYYGCCNIVHS